MNSGIIIIDSNLTIRGVIFHKELQKQVMLKKVLFEITPKTIAESVKEMINNSQKELGGNYNQMIIDEVEGRFRESLLEELTEFLDKNKCELLVNKK